MKGFYVNKIVFMSFVTYCNKVGEKIGFLGNFTEISFLYLSIEIFFQN